MSSGSCHGVQFCDHITGLICIINVFIAATTYREMYEHGLNPLRIKLVENQVGILVPTDNKIY
jgi:hypothetical protein